MRLTFNLGVRKELAGLAALAAGVCLLRQRPRWAGGLLLGAAALRFWPAASFSLKNRVVVITGGSRGLGLALAEGFARKGARVALLARQEDELTAAREILQKRTGQTALIAVCDVTQELQLRQAIELVANSFGQIDVLVNNAGTIALGPFESMTREDFDELLATQLYAVASAARLVKPWFARQGGGRIVNICSVGGKIAIPHLSAYCAAKFAMAGLSEAIAAEWGPEGVLITTVYPGLMRTGSPIQATIKGNHEKEFAWFALGDTIPGLAIAPDKAARRIIAGVCQGDAEVVFPITTQAAVVAQHHFPELGAWAARAAAAILPQNKSPEAKSGEASKGWLERQFWYAPFRPLARSAERKYNQKAKAPAGNGAASATRA